MTIKMTMNSIDFVSLSLILSYWWTESEDKLATAAAAAVDDYHFSLDYRYHREYFHCDIHWMTTEYCSSKSVPLVWVVVVVASYSYFLRCQYS